MLDPNTFEEIEGVLEVKSQFQDYLTIEGIGRDNNWISFAVATVEEIDQDANVRNKIPGATIQISSSEYASPLTAEEFLTVYSIVKDIDLSGIQLQLTMLAMLSDNDNSVNYQQPAPQYQQPQRQPQYQQPAPAAPHGGRAPYQPNQAPAQPRYGNGGTRNTFKPRQQTPATRPQPEVQVTPHDFMDENSSPKPSQGSRGNLPPRKGEKSIVNMRAVEETPVADIDFNDPEAIENIFNDEE